MNSRKKRGAIEKNKKAQVKEETIDDNGSSSSVNDEERSFSEGSESEDHHQEQMRRMDEMFQAPFMGLGFGRDGPLSLEDGRHRRSDRHHQRQEQRAQNAQVSRQNQFMDPFSHFNSMFSNMRSMMSDMHRAFEQVPNDPNTHMFQQSSFYSSSNMGNGTPKVFQASSSMRQLPGGVRETRKAVRDSETGVERVAMGHHINDRAHIIERSRNAHTGETNENQELINIDEEEAPAFDTEYHDRWHNTMKGVEQRRQRIRDLTHRPSHSQRALPEQEGTSRRPRKTSHRKN